MKKLSCIILSIFIIFAITSCKYTAKTVISSDGKVQFSTVTVITEAELKKVKTLLGDIFASYKTKNAVQKQLSVFNNIFTIQSNADETIKFFKDNSEVKTVNGVVTYTYKATKNYTSLKSYNNYVFPSSQKLNKQGKASVYDYWRFINGGASNSTSAIIADLYGISLTQNEYITLPEKIAKTNCKRIDNYTVKLTSKNIAYVTTVKSTASWTKEKNIYDAVLSKVKKAIKPPKIKKVKVAYKNKNNIKISWIKQKNCDDYIVMRKFGKKGKWKLLDYSLGKTKLIDNTFTRGEKIYYKVRGIIYETGFTVFGKFSSEKSIKVANLNIKPKIYVSGQKRSAVVSSAAKEKYILGFEITYSRYRDFKNSTVINVKGLPKRITKLKQGRRYSFKVRKYIKINGKKYYSPYSDSVRVRIRY